FTVVGRERNSFLASRNPAVPLAYAEEGTAEKILCHGIIRALVNAALQRGKGIVNMPVCNESRDALVGTSEGRAPREHKKNRNEEQITSHQRGCLTDSLSCKGLLF